MLYLSVLWMFRLVHTCCLLDLRYGQPMIAFCCVWNKQLDSRNAIYWKALISRPQTNKPVLHIHIHILPLLFHTLTKSTKWKPLILLSLRCQPIQITMLDLDVIGGCSFLRKLRNLSDHFLEGVHFLAIYWEILDLF